MDGIYLRHADIPPALYGDPTRFYDYQSSHKLLGFTIDEAGMSTLTTVEKLSRTH
jgi:hypothetical protein